jgi:dihydrodipicolinate synthase/N-acetylneuraminate lyase
MGKSPMAFFMIESINYNNDVGAASSLNMIGVPACKIRLPMVPLKPENRETLRKALVKLGRLKG